MYFCCGNKGSRQKLLSRFCPFYFSFLTSNHLQQSFYAFNKVDSAKIVKSRAWGNKFGNASSYLTFDLGLSQDHPLNRSSSGPCPRSQGSPQSTWAEVEGLGRPWRATCPPLWPAWRKGGVLQQVRCYGWKKNSHLVSRWKNGRFSLLYDQMESGESFSTLFTLSLISISWTNVLNAARWIRVCPLAEITQGLAPPCFTRNLTQSSLSLRAAHWGDRIQEIHMS